MFDCTTLFIFIDVRSHGGIGENCKSREIKILFPKKLGVLQLFSPFATSGLLNRSTATMYLLTQESKTWKIEEEARLRFSALNEA